MDLLALKSAKNYTNQVALGIGSMRVEDTTVYFTIAATGEEVSVTVPTPADGVSVIDVIMNEDHQLICTLSNGEEIIVGTIDVIKGDPGVAGFSPTAKVEQTEDGAVITITDAEGTTTATIFNGRNGEGSSNVQSDYEQTDETAGDYIKNKPEFEVLTEADIIEYLGLSDEELEGLSSVISDTEVRLDKTYSSSKIYSELNTLNSRINSFTTLAEGSTTGDAELIDARTDHEGVTWENVGNHIRGVTSRLSDSIGAVNKDLLLIKDVLDEPLLTCVIAKEQNIFTLNRSFVAGDVISVSIKNVKASFTGSTAISIQKRVDGSWKTLIPLNTPTGDMDKFITLDTDVDNIRVVGLITGSDATVSSFSCDLCLYYGLPGTVTVGSTGHFTSIIEALKNTDDRTAIKVLKGTYDIYSEYENYYGVDFWTNYSGYATSTDNFTRGLWLGSGRKIFGENGAKLTFSNPKTNSNISAYFSIFANDNDVIIENLIIDIGYRCVRYAIHDDFQPTKGYVIFKDIMFIGTPSTGAVIGAGLGVDVNYIIDNCIFCDNGGEYDISYHGNTNKKITDNQCKITVKNCFGDKKCWFGWYGTSLSTSYCIVHNSHFSEVLCSACNENQTNENMTLVSYNNTVNVD